jgi:ABC-2 type transport system permease protein
MNGSMNSESNAVPDLPLESRAVAPAASAATRPMYWSIRRELWENRSIYVAPLGAAGLVLLGFLIGLHKLRETLPDALALGPEKLWQAVNMPYDMGAAVLLLTAALVGTFYCLDALYGERRDRTILFWKSMPVSDWTAVLSKASIPLVVLPAITYVVILVLHFVMALFGSMALSGSGVSVGTYWGNLQFLPSSVAIFYCLIVIALWHAPLYAWFLLVSAWARRLPILWALLVPLAICALEGIAFHSMHFASFLGYRVVGWFDRAFAPLTNRIGGPIDPLTSLSPGKFLATPALWLGLVAAAILLAGAVRLRRNREAI